MVSLQEKAQPHLTEAVPSEKVYSSSQTLKCDAGESRELAAVSKTQICNANPPQCQERYVNDGIGDPLPQENMERSLFNANDACSFCLNSQKKEERTMVHRDELDITPHYTAPENDTDQCNDTKFKTDEIEPMLNGHRCSKLDDDNEKPKHVVEDKDTHYCKVYSDSDETTELPESSTNNDQTDLGENVEVLSVTNDGSVFQVDDTDHEDNNSDLNCNKLNHPIDQGYAWVIMIAVFFVQFLLIGYLKSLGIFFVEFQKEYGSNASALSIIIGLGEAIASIGCFLVMGFMLKKVTPRTSCIIGSCFLVVGVIGNSLFSRIEYLLLTHAVGYAMATSMMYGPSLYVLTQYFNKRRPLATSIATCGTSCGGIVFPFLIRYLLKEYDFQGGILLTAGMLMQSFIFCSLLRPVEIYSIKRQDVEGSKTSQLDRNSEKTVWNNLQFPLMSQSQKEDLRDIQSQNSLPSQHEKYCQNVSIGQLYRARAAFLKKVEDLNPRLEICEEGVPLEIEQNLIIDKAGEFKWIPVEQGISGNSPLVTHQPLHLHYDCQQSGSFRSIHSACNQPGYHSENSAEISKQDIEATLSVHSSKGNQLWKPIKSQLLQLQSTVSEISIESDAHPDNKILTKHQLSLLSRSMASIFRSTSTLQANFGDIITSEHEGYAEHSYKPRKAQTFYQRFCFSCRNNVLIRSAAFWVLTLFFFFACIGQALPQIFIPALAKERGLSEDDGAFFLSLLNLLDFPSRLFAGVIVNFGILRPSSACVGPVLVIGILGNLVPFFNSYESLLAMVIVYGLFNGTYFAMQSLVVIDVLGMEHFASAIGFFYLIMGCGGAISYPIAGILKDTSGTYSSSYHFLGSASLACFVLLLIMPFAKRYDLQHSVLQEAPEDT